MVSGKGCKAWGRVRTGVIDGILKERKNEMMKTG